MAAFKTISEDKIMADILNFIITTIVLILLITITMISIIVNVFLWKEIKRIINNETT
jgi:hypothetical protein